MAGSLRSGNKRNRKGRGHGQRNHRHASGNGMVRYYYGLYQQVLRERQDRRKIFKMYATIREAFDDISRRLGIEVASWSLLAVA